MYFTLEFLHSFSSELIDVEPGLNVILLSDIVIRVEFKQFFGNFFVEFCYISFEFGLPSLLLSQADTKKRLASRSVWRGSRLRGGR